MGLLRLPASEDCLPQFRQFALDEAARAGLDLAAQQRVELVLEEALINVIRHAYSGANSGVDPGVDPKIELACGTDADGVFRLVLSDWGAAFDPVGATQAAQPSDDAPADQDDDLLSRLESNLEADLEHRALGGMGLFLIRTMSQPAYARQDQANVLTLRFPPATED